MKGGKINFLDLCREVVSSLGEKEEEEKRKRSEKSVGEVRGGNKKGKFVLRRERKDAKISRNPIQTGVRQTSLTFESTKRILSPPRRDSFAETDGTTAQRVLRGLSRKDEINRSTSWETRVISDVAEDLSPFFYPSKRSFQFPSFLLLVESQKNSIFLGIGMASTPTHPARK